MTKLLLTASLCLFLFTDAWTRGILRTDGNLVEKLHNDVRLKVREGKVPGQPKGVNVGNLKWDNALAQKALEHAKECVFAHNTVKDPRWSWVGQNIYVSGSSIKKANENWKDAVNAWYNEYKVYKFSKDFSAQAGHYTQLVWADTKYVGCGYAYCPDKQPFQHYYVCNYGPGGNIVGQYPYKTA